MADAGRVKHHISNNIENSRNSILMSGYCEPHSLGAKLQSGRKEVNIYGVVHEIHAEIGIFTDIEIPELHQELGLG
jgi:metallo-beta-lactamase family protein